MDIPCPPLHVLLENVIELPFCIQMETDQMTAPHLDAYAHIDGKTIIY
jgi:hypothetical protein